MKNKLFLFAICFQLLSCSTVSLNKNKNISDDPYLWLEDIESVSSLEWVEKQNAKSLLKLEKDSRFLSTQKAVENIISASDRIPYVKQGRGWLYNFWQDKKNIRGVWRRTVLNQYVKTDIRWNVLLDIDLLAKNENENWVWKGAKCLPDDSRCLVFLSRGGKDAITVREFDPMKKVFIKDGFELKEAKSRIDWIDKDNVYVGSDFGPGSLTDSGYPRFVKIWKRHTELVEAQTIFEGDKKDVSVGGFRLFRPEGEYSFIERRTSFFETELFFIPKGELPIKINIPKDTEFLEVFKGQAIFLLRSDWLFDGKIFKTGEVISITTENFKSGIRGEEIKSLFVPTSRSSFQDIGITSKNLLIVTNENVTGRIYSYIFDNNKWNSERLSLPDYGSLNLLGGNSFEPNIFVNYESFLIPSSLYLIEVSKNTSIKLIKSLPQRFDISNHIVEQREVQSKDGTLIPYFVIKPKTQQSTLPTLLYGYGGFENSLTPYYLGALGKTWLEKNRVYVLANIRGGGEFGPQWHKAALKENRQKAFDDFLSVAEDLIKQNITEPKKLGISGASNGGLLVGAAFTQRPELFNAVVCAVPLLDMLRFHKLLAGASWVAEYGNPDDIHMRDMILKYSPYHNISLDKKYPEVFFITSTKDDRVHPGHARKMVAKLESNSQPVLYFENTEGGHGAASNLKQKARMEALKLVYLIQKLEN